MMSAAHLALALVTWAFVVIGLMLIVCKSFLFLPIRQWAAGPYAKDDPNFSAFDPRCRWFGKLISCPMCFSTWVGFALSLTGMAPVRLCFGWPWWAAILADGAAASAVGWYAHVHLYHIGAGKL
jgi:hypothetical protein